MYESKVDDRSIPLASQNIFWYPINILSVVWLVLAVFNVITFFLPTLCLCLYNFVLLRINYRYFDTGYKMKGTHIEQLIRHHGHDQMSQYNRGTLVCKFDDEKR